jgi:hypothetical protein
MKLIDYDHVSGTNCELTRQKSSAGMNLGDKPKIRIRSERVKQGE